MASVRFWFLRLFYHSNRNETRPDALSIQCSPASLVGFCVHVEGIAPAGEVVPDKWCLPHAKCLLLCSARETPQQDAVRGSQSSSDSHCRSISHLSPKVTAWAFGVFYVHPDICPWRVNSVAIPIHLSLKQAMPLILRNRDKVINTSKVC